MGTDRPRAEPGAYSSPSGPLTELKGKGAWSSRTCTGTPVGGEQPPSRTRQSESPCTTRGEPATSSSCSPPSTTSVSGTLRLRGPRRHRRRADLPRHERRLRSAGTEQVVHDSTHPTERCRTARPPPTVLARHDVAVHGLVCQSREARTTDPAFYDAVAQDMNDSGTPLLGWVTRPERLLPHQALPSRSPLEDSGFVSAHIDAARQILTVLPGTCAPAPWAGRHGRASAAAGSPLRPSYECGSVTERMLMREPCQQATTPHPQVLTISLGQEIQPGTRSCGQAQAAAIRLNRTPLWNPRIDAYVSGS